MNASADFAKLVPGFEFLQGLMKNAGAGLPGVSQWIAPTLNPEELEKRISELRTVQFWLEQNARMLGVTIQALEVQRMTLSTLQSMNVPIAQISESLRMKPAEVAAAAPEPAAERAATKQAPETEAAPAAAAGVVDPMLWWGALTKQFSDIAASALKEGTAEAAKSMAGAMVKQPVDVAGQPLKKTARAPAKAPARAPAARKRRT